MPHEFAGPAGEELLNGIRDIFQERPIFLRADKSIVFVCGGRVGDTEVSMRAQFLRWVRTEFPDVVPILAEKAYDTTYRDVTPRKIDLLKLEELMGNIAECVVLFPESEGSFAEMGYFSRGTDIKKKILIVNDINYQAENSFVNHGPIEAIDSRSYFGPHLRIDPKAKPIDFSYVSAKFQKQLVPRRNRHKFKYAPFRELDHRNRLFVVFEMVKILRSVSIEGLWRAMKTCFDAATKDQLRLLLSILEAAKYIRRAEGEFWEVENREESLLEYKDFDINKIISAVSFYYSKYDRAVLDRLSRRAP